jgi:hypothetical protein
MNKIELRNQTKFQFTDISNESERVYQFPDEEDVIITEPVWLSVSPNSGGHRILDAAGICHYIPYGWIHLYWLPKAGQPHFVK